MTWQARFRFRTFTRGAVWFYPLLGLALALVLGPVLRRVEAATQWTLLGIGPEGGRALLGALSASLLTFIVFAFSILLLAIQLASAQLSPRIIARVFERRLTRVTLGAFTFAYVYTTGTLGRIEDRTPQLPVLVAILSGVFCILLFVHLTQTVGRGFRPIAIMTGIGRDGRAMIEQLYPHPYTGSEVERGGHAFDPPQPFRAVPLRRGWGVLIDFDTAGLVALAARSNCTIELVPEIGDFVATGDVVFRLRGPGAGSVTERSLHEMLGLGSERILRRDLAFSFRIIVDIASKALSPAINDPTTGTLAVDQLHHLLHTLGLRQFSGGIVKDGAGIERLFFRSPSFDDFVTLATTEIRLYGATSPQVTRRLMAMLQQLAADLPAERVAVVRRERALLERTIERSYPDPEDRATAGVSDLQGFGSRIPAGTGSPS